MKTKEEILDESASPYNCRHIGRYRDSALQAMETYAQQANEGLREALEKIKNGYDKDSSYLSRIATEALSNLKQDGTET